MAVLAICRECSVKGAPDRHTHHRTNDSAAELDPLLEAEGPLSKKRGSAEPGTGGGACNPPIRALDAAATAPAVSQAGGLRALFQDKSVLVLIYLATVWGFVSGRELSWP